MAVKNIHYLNAFAPDFQWQKFAQATPGVPEDEALIQSLWQLARPQVVWREGRITSRADYLLTIDDGAMTIDSAYVAQGLVSVSGSRSWRSPLGQALPETASRQLAEGELYRGTIARPFGLVRRGAFGR